MKPVIIPNWQDKVVYAADGPHPQRLVSTEKLKSVLVGLEAGQKIPPHPGPLAVYHFLDGAGAIIVNGERIPVQAGTTVVVPDQAERGMEAGARLAFLGTHSGEK